MSKDTVKKGRFGISAEDASELRRAMRTAAQQHGENVVVSRLGFDSLTAACEAVHIDMTRADFGTVRNGLKALEPRREKVNKYADRKGPKLANG
jgi:hypothetical protein